MKTLIELDSNYISIPATLRCTTKAAGRREFFDHQYRFTRTSRHLLSRRAK